MNMKSFEEYLNLSPKKRIAELKEWMAMHISRIKKELRLNVFVDEQPDTEAGEAIELAFDELPTLLNEYDKGSVAEFIVKYRLEHNIEVVEDAEDILDLKEIGEIIAREIQCMEPQRRGYAYDAQKDIDIMIQICKIFSLKEEYEDLLVWRPNIQ